jgi:hypothetical protein
MYHILYVPNSYDDNDANAVIFLFLYIEKSLFQCRLKPHILYWIKYVYDTESWARPFSYFQKTLPFEPLEKYTG